MSVEDVVPNLIERLDDLLQQYNDLLNMNFDRECFRSMKVQEWRYKEKISFLEAKLKLTKMKLKFETDLRMKSEEERDKMAKTLKLKLANESRRTDVISNATSDDNFITASNSFIFTENDLNESNLLLSNFRKHQASLQNSNVFGIFGENPHHLTKIKSPDISYPGFERLVDKSSRELDESAEPSSIKTDDMGSRITHLNHRKPPVNHDSEKFIGSRFEVLKITPTKNSCPLYFSPRKGSTPLHQNSSCVDLSLDRRNLFESSNEYSISRFAPLVPPMIPMAVIHCIDEIERRGLKEIGLYRMAGDEEDIMNLHEKFENFGAEVNLAEINIHSIAAFLKSFLCNFPLIPKTFHDLFSQTIENNREELYYAISELPQANRDTLAYLIIHLRRVSFAPVCKMPASKLSAVFGPIVLGLHTCDKENQCSDIPIKVMEELFKLPSSYWNSFIIDPTSSETPTKLRNSPSTEEIVRKKAKKFFTTNVRKKKFFTSP